MYPIHVHVHVDHSLTSTMLPILELPDALVTLCLSFVPLDGLARAEAACRQLRGLLAAAASLRSAALLGTAPPDRGTGEHPLAVLAFVERMVARQRRSLTAGASHVIAVRQSDGAPFAWGSDDTGPDEHSFDLHHLGLGVDDGPRVCVPTPMRGLSGGLRVIEVSAGAVHSLVVDSGGGAWSCGDGTWGRLGHGGDQGGHGDACNSLRRIEALSGVTVVHASAGSLHSLVSTNTGELFSFGAHENGQLGLGTQEFDGPGAGRGRRKRKPEDWCSNLPRRVTTILRVAGLHEKFASASRTEALAASTYSDGAATSEDLGRIWQVSAGDLHCLALDERGQLLAWGNNTFDQLGFPAYGDSMDLLGRANTRRVPTPGEGDVGVYRPVLVSVEAPRTATDEPPRDVAFKLVAAGETHSLAVSVEGQLFAFGQGHDGELTGGIGAYSLKSLDRPTVPNLRALSIKSIAASNQLSLILTEEGQVYVCGKFTVPTHGSPVSTSRTSPHSWKSITDQVGPAVEVAAGDELAVIRAANGNVVAYGRNEEGQVGIGHAGSPERAKHDLDHLLVAAIA